MQNKITGALLGMAIGEALENNVLHGIADTEELKIGEETLMALRVGEALLESQTEESFVISFANKLKEWHSSIDPQTTVFTPSSQTSFAACWKMKEGVSLEDSGIPTATDSGSAMRAVPIGLYCTQPEQVVNYAISASGITHSHELCLCGSVAAAYITHLALTGVSSGVWANELVKINYCKEFKDIIKLAAENTGIDKPVKYVMSDKCLGSGQLVHETVAFALYSCMRYTRYDFAVMLAASSHSPGAATLTGAWMGAKLGQEGIPEAWISKLINKDKLLTMADNIIKTKHQAISQSSLAVVQEKQIVQKAV